MLRFHFGQAAQKTLQHTMITTGPEHISAMRQGERCRAIPCERPLAEMVDEGMGFAHRLGVLRGDLFQRRESLLRPSVSSTFSSCR